MRTAEFLEEPNGKLSIKRLLFAFWNVILAVGLFTGTVSPSPELLFAYVSLLGGMQLVGRFAERSGAG